MKNNPFVLPGFGQSGPQAENPILASMEMMRKAWEGLASTGGMDASAMGRLMSAEELDKRISDLRAVENWLRMNLSMLGSTIQGLEVQRATLATLNAFMETGIGMAGASAPAHPEAGAGGHKPASASRAKAAAQPQPGGATPDDGDAHNNAATHADRQSEASPKPGAGAAGADLMPGQEDIVGAAASAAQGWWNLLQQQFQTLAAATAASAASVHAAGDASNPGAPASKATKTAKTAKTATSASKATKSAAVKAARKAARKTTR